MSVSHPPIHFLYDPAKEPDASFARTLIDELGQADMSQASDVVVVSGDGGLLHALRRSAGKNVAGIVSPGSASVGFWMNRGVGNAADLLDLLHEAKAYPIKPLQADITFADRSGTTRYGYNDVSVRPMPQMPSPFLKDKFNLSDIDMSVQSVSLNLRAAFADAVVGPNRVMGGGIIFATSFGSTAMNRNFGGPSIDIRNQAIILTEVGIGYPAKGFEPIVNSADTVLHVDVLLQEKRPVIVTFDSFGVVQNEKASPVSSLRVSMAQQGAVKLLLKDDPGLRAYSAMMP